MSRYEADISVSVVSFITSSKKKDLAGHGQLVMLKGTCEQESQNYMYVYGPKKGRLHNFFNKTSNRTI
jgi:hypothetical protein